MKNLMCRLMAMCFLTVSLAAFAQSRRHHEAGQHEARRPPSKIR